MDPVSHTLMGAALAKAGLERRTPLAVPTMLIGANLPDVDVAAYRWGETFALTFRRGWTHGVLALALLPIILTALMLAWDRWVRRARSPAAAPATGPGLLLVSLVAVASHPLLDLLNVYGIRLLMPFSDRWFYGDVLFIVDPWFWLVLASGVLLAHRRGRAGPARAALAILAVYIGGMTASGLASRLVVLRAVRGGDRSVARLMSAPMPLTPFRRWVVVEEEDAYRVGDFDWLRAPRIRTDDMVVLPKGDAHSAVAVVTESAQARQFLSWARFPFVRVIERPDTMVVEVIDARYAVDADAVFGALTVSVPR